MNFQILEINGENEHIHALIEYPPKLSVSKIVNALKGVSSRRYGQAGFKKPHNKTALWSPSYFAVSVGGAPIDILIQYIKNQKKPATEEGACIPLFPVRKAKNNTNILIEVFKPPLFCLFSVELLRLNSNLAITPDFPPRTFEIFRLSTIALD